jgi:hypothetical protein
VLSAEREAVGLRRDTLVSHAVAALSSLAGNIDASSLEVNELLERYSGHPEQAVQAAWVRLDEWAGELEHINSAVEHLRRGLLDACRGHDLNDLEKVLERCSAHEHRRDLGREIFAAAERADQLAEAAVGELERLCGTGDLESIGKALHRFGGCKAPEVRRAHARLRARRAEVEEELKAADAVRLRLRLLTGTCSASEGVRALRASASLGATIQTEREQLQVGQ